MSQVPGREALEAMKRTDIQKLCKDYGVKANLKTEALIDLLLDASRPQAPRTVPPQPSRRPPSTRIPSLTPRPREQSSGSVIIHGELEEKDHPVEVKLIPGSQSSRARKAKQTQYRLGVGRPVLAGGSGARTITKSVSVSRPNKRAKSGRLIQPSEATIAEEPEVNTERTPEPTVKMTPVPSESAQRGGQRLEHESSSKLVDTVIAEALAPVQEELDSQRSQLTELKARVTGLIESFEAKIRDLTSEIETLRAQAKNSTSKSHDVSMTTSQDQPLRIPEPPSTPKRVRSPLVISFSTKAIASELSSDASHPDTVTSNDERSRMEQEQPLHPGSLLPGFPHSTLGKRSRDSTSGDASGMLELGKDDEVADTELANQPAPKRTRLLADEVQAKCSQTHPCGSPVTSESPRSPRIFRFAGQEERSHDDPLPPIEGLPDFSEGPSSLPLVGAPTMTGFANTAENQNPFSYSFPPVLSTPAQALYPLAMGTFPYPEVPTSPSPVTIDRPISHHSDRHSTIGLPRSSSRTSGAVASGSGELQRVPSSNEVASGLGLTTIKTSATEMGTPAPPAKRTMYGTELDEDTRFGDFGVEGVASGFWARGRF
ncbi:hypothetical protein F5I97DRAFT_1929952 [Phlebopus sp. FC_14]|nr:hypothetical protein F5I97DRAFT_1929952 [Phlebopus sp. FC_14]